MLDMTLTLGDALVILLVGLLAEAITIAAVSVAAYHYLSGYVEDLIMPAETQGGVFDMTPGGGSEEIGFDADLRNPSAAESTTTSAPFNDVDLGSALGDAEDESDE